MTVQKYINEEILSTKLTNYLTKEEYELITGELYE